MDGTSSLTPEQASPDATVEEESSAQPRQVRRLVCGYELGSLPSWWLMVHRRIKTSVDRDGLRLKVELDPLSSLPQDVDLLVVPPELEASARERAPEAEIVVLGPQQYPGAAVELCARLRDPQQYRVEREQARSPDSPPQPKIVRYIGYHRAE